MVIMQVKLSSFNHDLAKSRWRSQIIWLPGWYIAARAMCIE